MKKFLFLGWILAAALTACDKDNEQNETGTCPVSDIELPQSNAQNPIEPGSTVEIRGYGFEADCEIWLFEETRAAASAGVKAEILEISASALRFTAPDLSGPQSIELRQNGGAWRIGSLFFSEEEKEEEKPEEETPVDILPRRISRIKITYPGDLSLVQRFAYDEQGRIASITETDQQYNAYPGATAQDEVTVFAYESDRIVITEPSGARSILSLTDGRVTTISGVAFNDHYPDDYAFTYDANGYIATSTWIQNPDKTYSAKSIYTVEEGCLTQVREAEDSGEWYGGNASYTNNPERPNNLNIDLFGISDFITTTDLDRIYLVGAGGNRLKKLPSTIDYGENGIDTYRYTTEGEYISKIEIDEDGEPLTILEIFYEK